VPGFSNVTAQGTSYRVFLMQTSSKFIQVAQDLAARQELAGGLVLRMVGPVMLLAPVLMLAVWGVVTQSTRPLARARQQVARRAADELSPLMVPGLPDEVRPLVDEINLLFARLADAFDAQRSFVADAAHELRSPLAALRLQVQSMQRATDIARHMVTHYGMSESLGLATFEEPRSAMFLDPAMQQQRAEYSERTAQSIDDEIRKLLAEAHERVAQTLKGNRNKLDVLAKLLQEKEVVDRAALDALMSSVARDEASLRRVAFVSAPSAGGSSSDGRVTL